MAPMADPRLKIYEIFFSIQGESTFAGRPCVLVRLTGCQMRCSWCDTEYAFHGGAWMSLEEVLSKVAAFGCPLVEVTGGEPLLQPACLPLLTALCDAGHSVSLETSGALDISGVDPRVSRIVDLKAPDSGESAKNRWENIDLLRPTDEIKFVLASRTDYDWAKSALAGRRLDEICPVLFSPVTDRLPPATLAGWILEDRLPVRFQLQLHKLLWGQQRGK